MEHLCIDGKLSLDKLWNVLMGDDAPVELTEQDWRDLVADSSEESLLTQIARIFLDQHRTAAEINIFSDSQLQNLVSATLILCSLDQEVSYTTLGAVPLLVDALCSYVKNYHQSSDVDDCLNSLELLINLFRFSKKHITFADRSTCYLDLLELAEARAKYYPKEEPLEDPDADEHDQYWHYQAPKSVIQDAEVLSLREKAVSKVLDTLMVLNYVEPFDQILVKIIRGTEDPEKKYGGQLGSLLVSRLNEISGSGDLEHMEEPALFLFSQLFSLSEFDSMIDSNDRSVVVDVLIRRLHANNQTDSVAVSYFKCLRLAIINWREYEKKKYKAQDLYKDIERWEELHETECDHSTISAEILELIQSLERFLYPLQE